MSIIVVVKKNGQAAIAADTLQSDDSAVLKATYVTNHEKIIAYKESFVGLAGWAAAQDIFESIIRNHEDKLDLSGRAAIFETALKLHGLMKSDYHIDTQEEKDQPVESSQLCMLIANPTGIFEMDSYRSVTEYERYWALGSGRTVALGALYASYDRYDAPLDIARAAVEAACEFDDGCAMPATGYAVALA